MEDSHKLAQQSDQIPYLTRMCWTPLPNALRNKDYNLDKNNYGILVAIIVMATN